MALSSVNSRTFSIADCRGLRGGGLTRVALEVSSIVNAISKMLIGNLVRKSVQDDEGLKAEQRLMYL